MAVESLPLVTATAHLDDAPCPYAEIVVDKIPATAATVTLWRISDGRTEAVRGAVRAAATGALVRIDFEAPFGVLVEYRAEIFDAGGLSLGLSAVGDVRLEETATWLHNPLNPRGAVRVAFRQQAARSIDRPMDAEIVHPIGRRIGVVVGSGRRGITDVNLDVITDDLGSADLVRDLLGTESAPLDSVLCFRIGAHDRIRLPRPFYAAVQTISEIDITYAAGTGETIAHHMTGTEASPPAPGIFIPLLTYAHWAAFYPTYAALSADNATYLDASRRYDLVRDL